MRSWFKKTPPAASGPDFSAVTSAAAAEALAAEGVLAPLLLLPEVFGGEDMPLNVVYVPAWVVEAKADIDQNVVAPLVAGGRVSAYDAAPEYEGKSFVPVAIRIEASGPGAFATTINVWGAALSR